MNEIMKAAYKSQMPELKVGIGIFKNKESGEIRFCVMSVSTGICDRSESFIFDASEWERLDDKLLEGTERIQAAFHNSLLRVMEGGE